MSIHTGGPLPALPWGWRPSTPPGLSCGTLRVHRRHVWLSQRTHHLYGCPGVRRRI